LAAGLALQLAFGIAYAWGAVVPLIRAQEHWPPVLLGAVFAGTPAGYGVGTALGGRLADRLPPRRLCWAGLGLLAVGFGLAFALPTGLTFVAGYAFVALGLGGGLALTGTVAALVQVYPRRPGMVAGVASAAYAASAVFQAPLVGALAPRLGWIGALRAVALGMAVVAALLLALMPALPARSTGGHLGGPPLLFSPAVWSGVLLALCGATFGSFATVNLGAEAVGRHLGGGLAAAAIAVFAAGNAAGRLLAGLAADRLGVARVVLAVFLLDLGAAALLFSGSGAAGVLLAAAAAGGGLGADAGALGRMGVDAAPDRPNSAFGLVFGGFTAGVFVGPLAGALVGVPAGWLVMATPALAGLALLAARPRLVAQPA
jgi:MFS family permease